MPDRIDEMVARHPNWSRKTDRSGSTLHVRAPADAVTAAVPIFDPVKHPRHPSGSHVGGQWRSLGGVEGGGPVVDDAHVVPEIDQYVGGGRGGWAGGDIEKADLLARYREEYQPPIDTLKQRLQGFPDAVIQPQVNLDALGGESPEASGYIAVTLKTGDAVEPYLVVTPNGTGGLEVNDGNDFLTDTRAIQKLGDLRRFEEMKQAIETGPPVLAVAAAGFDPTKHPREPGGTRVGGRWARSSGPSSAQGERWADVGAVDSPPKSDLAYSVYGDAADTEQLYRDFARYPDTDGWPPDRALSQRAAIASTLQGHEPPLGTPTTVFMAGGSGAGKSTMKGSGANAISAQLDAPILNPDDFKKAIDEYAQLWDAGDEYAAWGAHEESSYMAAKALAAANDRGVNVIVDGTGDSGGTKFLDKVKAAEALGRNTKVVMVDIPTEEAIARATARAVDPASPSYKRFVNEAEIRRVHASVVDRHLQWRDQIDNWEVWDNQAAEPKLVARRVNGGRIEVLHPSDYTRILRKADARR